MKRHYLFLCLFNGLLLTICLLKPFTGPIYAAEFTVTKTEDTRDGQCNEDCSLREAIQAANVTTNSDTILLPAGVFTITLGGNNEDFAATGDLDITNDLIIKGAGPEQTIIDGKGQDRIFELRNFFGIEVTITDLTLRNGRVSGPGGGIAVRSNTQLTLSNSNIYSNTSSSSDGGGGIHIQGSGVLTLLNSSVIRNTSNGWGGGINNNNRLSIANSTISHNRAAVDGGGIYNGHTADFNNVTIADNISGNLGGGLRDMGGTMLTFKNTLLAGNSENGGLSPSDCHTQPGTPLISGGYNLIQDASNCELSGDTATDITGQVAALLPLQLNEKRTFSHALSSLSPAVDAGHPALPGSEAGACLPHDQRGLSRPVDGNRDQTARCDIGAYELGLTTYLPLVFK
jgi:CSLREA domain-containing protein